MRSLLLALPFILLTIAAWGNYGPLMHHGQDSMGRSSLRPFIGVGMAYFLVAVLFPLFVLKAKGEKGAWSVGGTVYSLLAGSVGALGALGVILAFKFGGLPVYVMPIVFGNAPVINTIVTAWMSGTFKQVNALFIAGIVLAAAGGAGVYYFKPAKAKPASTETSVAIAANRSNLAESTTMLVSLQGDSAATTDVPSPAAPQPSAPQPSAPQPSAPQPAAPETQWGPLMLAVLAAVLCWGSYGPVLHKGQLKMGGSRLRPFLCVGLAYFVIAVATPLILLGLWTEQGGWTTVGTLWSLAGGAAGAIGALGIILAFNAGGKPIFVMPLIFGLAPVMNTATTLTEAGLWGQIDWKFMVCLAVAIAGAVMVLVFAPKAAPHAAPAKS
jgi:hypothetical protein